MSTFFSILFAVATLATFALGLWPPLRNARITSATVAVLSFLMALATAH
jgi:hypothetical protein